MNDLHLLGAGLALAAALLYADRTGWLVVRGTQGWEALLTRLGVALVFVGLVLGFVDLYFARAPFEPRHIFICGALSIAVVGHLLLRRGGGRNPT